jgi:chorismate mutase
MEKSPAFEAQLAAVRKQIDAVDSALVRLLAKRFSLVKKVGKIKKATGRPPTDRNRERLIVSRARFIAQKTGLPVPVVEKVFYSIFTEAKKMHRRA